MSKRLMLASVALALSSSERVRKFSRKIKNKVSKSKHSSKSLLIVYKDLFDSIEEINQCVKPSTKVMMLEDLDDLSQLNGEEYENVGLFCHGNVDKVNQTMTFLGMKLNTDPLIPEPKGPMINQWFKQISDLNPKRVHMFACDLGSVGIVRKYLIELDQQYNIPEGIFSSTNITGDGGDWVMEFNTKAGYLTDKEKRIVDVYYYFNQLPIGLSLSDYKTNKEELELPNNIIEIKISLDDFFNMYKHIIGLPKENRKLEKLSISPKQQDLCLGYYEGIFYMLFLSSMFSIFEFLISIL